MKVEARDLRSALAWACSAIPAKPTQPMLGAAVLHSEAGELFVAGFNGDTHAVAAIDCEGEDMPQTLVAGHVLRSMVEQLDATVTVEVVKGALRLKSARTTFNLLTMVADYYPSTPPMPPMVGRIDAGDLQELTGRAATASGLPNNPTPIFTVMALEAKGGQIRATATDRHRLHRTQWEWIGDDFAVLVAAREIADLAKNLRGTVTVMMAEDSGVMALADDQRQVSLRLMAADIPKVDTLLLDDDKSPVVIVSQDALVTAFRTALVAAGKDGHVMMTTAESVITLSGLGMELGEGDVEVNADCAGDPASYIFNAGYFTDAIAALPGSHVLIQLPSAANGYGKVKLQGLAEPSGQPIPAVTTVVMSAKPRENH